jgi:hypothetical protein
MGVMGGPELAGHSRNIDATEDESNPESAGPPDTTTFSATGPKPPVAHKSSTAPKKSASELAFERGSEGIDDASSALNVAVKILSKNRGALASYRGPHSEMLVKLDAAVTGRRGRE